MDNITPLLPTGPGELDCERFNLIINAIRERSNHLGTQNCATTLSGLEDCISNSSAFGSLQTSIASLTSSYNTLRDDIYQSGGYIQGLIDNNDTLLRSLIDGLETQVNANTNLVQTLEVNVSTLSSRVGSLEVDMVEVQSAIANLENLLGVDFAVSNIVRLDTDNIYTADSTVNDFSLSQNLLVPFVNKNYSDVATSDKNALSAGWLKTEARNLLEEELLTVDNTWTEDNEYVKPPVLLNNPGVDNLTNEVISATWVRANIARNFLSGGAPIIYKDTVNSNRLLWTAGTLAFNGTEYNIPAGGYTYGQEGQFYVIADATGNVVNINPSSLTSPGSSETNKQILGEVNIVLGSDSNYDIRQVNGLTLSIGDFATKSLPNIFKATNNFTEKTTFEGPVEVEGEFTFTDTSTPATDVLVTTSVNPPDEVPEGENYLATTEWVKNRVSQGVLSYLATDDIVVFNDEVLTSDTVINLEGNTIYVDEPPLEADDNQVATVKYVNQKIDGSIVIPEFTVEPGELILNFGEGLVPLPAGTTCTGTSCVGGNFCRINNGKVDIFPDTKVVYIDYSDCRVRVANEPIPESDGKILGYININLDPDNPNSGNYIIEVTPVSTTKYAPIESPSFSGVPVTPLPPENSDNNTIPNTAWVQDRLYDLIHKPCDAESTTRPSVINKAGLLINITPGYIDNPSGTTITVNSLDEDLALVDNTQEYVYVRYSDSNVVASTTIPSTNIGKVIARVITQNGSITGIFHEEGFSTTCTEITRNYKVGFGGNLIYVPEINP